MSETPYQSEAAPTYEPTQEGLGMALDAALGQHAEAIVHIEAERGDQYGRTGGDQLILYPDSRDPRKTIRIAPVGADAETRRFPAAQGLHVTYDGKGAVGSGTYRVHGGIGERFVQRWTGHPEVRGAIQSSDPETANYASLIEALSGASTEKPAGRSKQVLRALGNLASR